MKDTVRRLIPLVVLVLLLTIMILPKKLEEKAAMSFGEPLFSHALPEGSRLLQKDAAEDDQGGVTAALLLQTDWSSEELEAFYADAAIRPAKEGQTVSLQAKALDEGSIEALKKAKLYEEGANYQFVYLYSH